MKLKEWRAKNYDTRRYTVRGYNMLLPCPFRYNQQRNCIKALKSQGGKWNHQKREAYGEICLGLAVLPYNYHYELRKE